MTKIYYELALILNAKLYENKKVTLQEYKKCEELLLKEVGKNNGSC